VLFGGGHRSRYPDSTNFQRRAATRCEHAMRQGRSTVAGRGASGPTRKYFSSPQHQGLRGPVSPAVIPISVSDGIRCPGD
jgi:hypothetical protein